MKLQSDTVFSFTRCTQKTQEERWTDFSTEKQTNIFLQRNKQHISPEKQTTYFSRETDEEISPEKQTNIFLQRNRRTYFSRETNNIFLQRNRRRDFSRAQVSLTASTLGFSQLYRNVPKRQLHVHMKRSVRQTRMNQPTIHCPIWTCVHMHTINEPV